MKEIIVQKSFALVKEDISSIMSSIKMLELRGNIKNLENFKQMLDSKFHEHSMVLNEESKKSENLRLELMYLKESLLRLVKENSDNINKANYELIKKVENSDLDTFKNNIENNLNTKQNEFINEIKLQLHQLEANVDFIKSDTTTIDNTNQQIFKFKNDLESTKFKLENSIKENSDNITKTNNEIIKKVENSDLEKFKSNIENTLNQKQTDFLNEIQSKLNKLESTVDFIKSDTTVVDNTNQQIFKFKNEIESLKSSFEKYIKTTSEVQNELELNLKKKQSDIFNSFESRFFKLESKFDSKLELYDDISKNNIKQKAQIEILNQKIADFNTKQDKKLAGIEKNYNQDQKKLLQSFEKKFIKFEGGIETIKLSNIANKSDISTLNSNQESITHDFENLNNEFDEIDNHVEILIDKKIKSNNKTNLGKQALFKSINEEPIKKSKSIIKKKNKDNKDNKKGLFSKAVDFLAND